MQLELVKQNSTQRYYKLPRPIRYYGNGRTFEDLFKADPIKLKPGFELIGDLSEIQYVCVSDAHTHIERLCFPAFEVREIASGEVQLVHRNNTICGYPTFKIYGGDPAMVWPDGVYIRYLLIANRRKG